MTLKFGSGVTKGHRKWHRSVVCLWFPISVLQYSNCVCKMHPFGDIRLLKVPWPWKPGQGHSRSLQMIPFDRSCTTSYSCSIVTMALSRNVFEIFDVKEYNDLEIRVMGHSRSPKVTPFDSLHVISYWHPLETLCLKCTVFEISWHIGRKSPKKTCPTLIGRPLSSEPPQISA